MIILKFIAFIVLTVLGIWMIHSLYFGIISGQLRHSDSSVAVKSERPVTFWLIAMIHIAMVLMVLFFPVKVLIELFIRMFGSFDMNMENLLHMNSGQLNFW
jgi:hypothetical protein